MADPSFARLVSQLLEAMGQEMAKVRETPEGLLVQTSEGFRFAFVADPLAISLASVRRLVAGVGEPARKLVVLSPSRLPLALSNALAQSGATTVEGGRFHELVRSLGLGQLLGDAPRPPSGPGSPRMLPSVQQLEEVMVRARTWMGWGVPALALRFYRQAAGLKPEYLPARTGAATALLALGLLDEAERAFEEVLALDPENLDAKLGRAALIGRRGRPEAEIEEYRRLLSEDPSRLVVRSHLVAALVALPDWAAAQVEIEAMIASNPDDPALRFLHAAALAHTGREAEASAERSRALALGLPFDREKLMADQLGLPAPEPRPEISRESPSLPPAPPSVLPKAYVVPPVAPGAAVASHREPAARPSRPRPSRARSRRPRAFAKAKRPSKPRVPRRPRKARRSR